MSVVILYVAGMGITHMWRESGQLNKSKPGVTWQNGKAAASAASGPAQAQLRPGPGSRIFETLFLLRKFEKPGVGIFKTQVVQEFEKRGRAFFQNLKFSK